MSLNGWKEVKLEDIIQFNPRENIVKKQSAKKIAMEKLKPFSRTIEGYEYAEFKGGAKFRNGDTLFASITPCLENGKTAQVSILNEDEVGFGSTEYIVLREKPNKSVNDFIYYLSISPRFRDTAIKSMIGTSGRQRVQRDVLKNARILLPSLKEQKAIAGTLSCLDDKIELNNRINNILEKIAQAIFKSWFVNFEPFQDGKFEDSELGMIPEGWRIENLDNIANYLNGLAMQKHRSETEEYLPVIKIRELNQGFTDVNSDKASVNILKQYVIQDGDIIFSWSGTLTVKIWSGGIGGLNQHLFKVTSNKYNRWFYYLWTLQHLNRFRAIAKDKATTMGHIRRGHLSESKVLIPKESDMRILDGIMNPIFEQMLEISVQNRNLRAIRDTLLPKLMSGEIRVPIKEVEQ